MKRSITILFVLLYLTTGCKSVNSTSNPAAAFDVDFYFLKEPQGITELFAWNSKTAQSYQITSTDGQLLDYAVDSSKGDLFYSVKNSLNGADVWFLKNGEKTASKRIDCQARTCAEPNISPDGLVLAYQSSDFPYDSAAYENNRRILFLPLLDVEKPLFTGKNGLDGFNLQWAPDGSAIAFYDPMTPGIVVLNQEGQIQLTINGDTISSIYCWNSSSDTLYFLVDEIMDDQPVTLMQRVFLPEKKFSRVPLEMGFTGIITGMIPSPLGDKLLLNVRASAFFPGQTLYIYDLADEEIVMELKSPDRSIGNISWSNDGDKIILQRYAFSQTNTGPEIGVWNLADGIFETLVSNAYLPKFAP